MLGELYDVYCSALGRDPESEGARAWRDEYLPAHAGLRDFVFLVADEGGDVLAIAYGYTGDYDQWWTDRVAAAMDDPTRREWLDPPHFQVVEVHVRPDRQRRGIGRRLLGELLESQPHDRALLSAVRDDERAQAFYRRLGWSPLVEVRFGKEYPPYVVLGKRL